ncbi:hypothetical protein ACFXDJ_33120 [Streptomyces sp. NPDC059443]|uniref:hypothetical protein n=1 Tax=unclassified Streptomyces TaxID=2593676 RepID=UPI0036ADA50F
MKRAAFRGIGLAAAASCCMALGAWGAPASEAGGPRPSQESRAAPAPASAPAPATSVPRCYATRSSPDLVVCYRTSLKAEYRHGEIVYVPVLIQVPTPSPPPPVIIVDSLDDVRPAGPP